MRRVAGDHLTRLTTCQPKVDHLPAHHHCPTIKWFSSLNCQLFVVELFSVPLIWIFLLRRPILKLTQHALLGWYRTIIQVQVSPCYIARLLNRAGLFNPLRVPTALLFTGGGSEHRSIKLCSADRQGCSSSPEVFLPPRNLPRWLTRWRKMEIFCWRVVTSSSSSYTSLPFKPWERFEIFFERDMSTGSRTDPMGNSLLPRLSAKCLKSFLKCHLSLRKRMPQIPNGICIKVNSIC